MPKNETKNLLFFLLPYLILFLLLFAFALSYSLILSFTNMSPGRPLEFTGATNYVRLFGDPLVWNGFKVVSTVLFIQVPIMTGLALILAILLSSPLIRGKTIFRTIFIIPVMTSLVAATLMWYPMFGENYGVINLVLTGIGLPGFKWLLDPTLALVSIFTVITWRWTGYNMIMFLAGLQAIPRELYDAAALDAGRLQTVRHITLPLLKPIIIFSVVFSIIGSLQLFAEPYVLTGQGTSAGFATYTVAIRLYNIGFIQGQFGYASAIGWFMALIAVCGTFFFLKRLGFFARGE